jgi:hypothetical protein
VTNRFQSLPFKCNLQRYTEGLRIVKLDTGVQIPAGTIQVHIHAMVGWHCTLIGQSSEYSDTIGQSNKIQ